MPDDNVSVHPFLAIEERHNPLHGPPLRACPASSPKMHNSLQPSRASCTPYQCTPKYRYHGPSPAALTGQPSIDTTSSEFISLVRHMPVHISMKSIRPGWATLRVR